VELRYFSEIPQIEGGLRGNFRAILNRYWTQCLVEPWAKLRGLSRALPKDRLALIV
jgi:hypothetical protein